MGSYYLMRQYFEPLMDAPCPKTDALIRSGFQQKENPDNYLGYARECGISVDYTQAMPNQGWHFIKSYLDKANPNNFKPGLIKCGELYYWLAEVSGALTNEELDKLAQDIKCMDYETATMLIKVRCFDKVMDIVKREHDCERY